ncbi:MAG: GtrA family protein [Rhodocyclaceae bacterium]|nr:MAG: GtrA family protein [Rhodocyclaceae bacterium]
MTKQGRYGLDAIRRIAGQHETKVRFLVAGFFNTVLGLITYPALYFLTAPLTLHYLNILVISQVICVSIAFLTNKFLVFRSSGSVLLEFGKFITFHLSYFLVNLVALPVMVEFAGMNPVWAQTLFAGLVIVSSYFWHSRITFSSTKATS